LATNTRTVAVGAAPIQGTTERLRSLKPGESCLFPYTPFGRTIHAYARLAGIKVSVRKEGDMARVTRMEEKPTLSVQDAILGLPFNQPSPLPYPWQTILRATKGLGIQLKRTKAPKAAAGSTSASSPRPSSTSRRPRLRREFPFLLLEALGQGSWLSGW
jgi:hypothetical protein